MRASIVIASCNEGELLGNTVRSCLDTAGGLDCEVVVADDCSEDGSVGRLRCDFPQVRVVAHAERRGVSLTKDLGARCARGDVLVFLDAHCKPEPGALAGLVAGVEELGGSAVLTPRVAQLHVERWENDLDQVGHGYAVSLESFDVWWLPLEAMWRHDGTRFRAQPTFIGCCVAMTRRLYDRLWGFDTGMRSYGSEDVDLGVKAWLMGHPVLHDPGPVIGHRFRAGFDTYPVPEEHILVNQLRMARKTFTDPVWFDWLARFSERQPAALWESAWGQYLEGHEGIERERAYLMANRVRDEFWFARAFGLPWPTPLAAGGPAPAPGRPPGQGPLPSPLPTPAPARSPVPTRFPPFRSPSPYPGTRPLRSPSPSPMPRRLRSPSPSPTPRKP